MRVREANWAAQVPWSGIQDIPAAFRGVGEKLAISDVDGLRAALNSKAGAGSGFSGRYSDLTGKPVLGSAAYVDVKSFVAAPTDRTYQRGQIDFVAGQQVYPVVFSVEMKAVPDIESDFYISDGTSEEMFYGAAQAVDTFGFNFWLNVPPAFSRGWCIWKAKVP